MSEKLESYLRSLKKKVQAAETKGLWFSPDDTNVLLSLIDAQFETDDAKRSDAEQILLHFELAAEEGKLDEEEFGDPDDWEGVDIDAVAPEDDSEETTDEDYSGEIPASKDL